VVRCHDTINADSTIALFEQLVAFHPMAMCIYVICDNAPCYCSKAVQDYLKASRIQLVFLPPSASNLNLIERLWGFFKKRVFYNRYYETFVEFRTAREIFFKNPRKYQPELRSLLAANFEIIGRMKIRNIDISLTYIPNHYILLSQYVSKNYAL